MNTIQCVARCVAALAAVTAASASHGLDRSGGHRDVRDFDRTGGNHYILCLHPCPDEATWAVTGNLNIARSSHTATLLPDGKVLAVGGFDGDRTLASAELYDPRTASWSFASAMHVARAGSTATLLPGPKVLVAGGGTNLGDVDDVTNTAELYDASTGLWSVTDGMRVARVGHTATLLQNGEVLVVGGDGYWDGDVYKLLGSAELYDPVTGTWSLTGNPAVARCGHTATLLRNGKVLVVGGVGNENGEYAERYDPSTRTWSRVGDVGMPRAGHTATLLPNGTVLVSGGWDKTSLAGAEIFDPTTGVWTPTGDLNEARSGHTATLLPNGNVLVAAGADFPNVHVVDSTEVYDAATATWTKTANLQLGRYGATGTLLFDGNVLLAGGSIMADATATSWTPIPQNIAETYQTSP